jgi:hypothetical protein
VVDRDLAPRGARRTGTRVIRVRHEPLPAGLSAVVRRRPGGDIDVVVSTLLSPARQRTAVRVGLRAARPADQRSMLPVPLLGALALAWTSARAVARGLRFHPAALVASAGVVTAVTAAAVVIAVVPNQHGAAGGGHAAAGALPAPTPAPAQSAGRPGRSTQPTTGPRSTARPAPSVVPVADRSAAAPARPTPTPGESGLSPGPPRSPPTAQPSPTPSAGGGGVCLELLGLRVCL